MAVGTFNIPPERQWEKEGAGQGTRDLSRSTRDWAERNAGPLAAGAGVATALALRNPLIRAGRTIYSKSGVKDLLRDKGLYKREPKGTGDSFRFEPRWRESIDLDRLTEQGRKDKAAADERVEILDEVTNDYGSLAGDPIDRPPDLYDQLGISDQRRDDLGSYEKPGGADWQETVGPYGPGIEKKKWRELPVHKRLIKDLPELRDRMTQAYERRYPYQSSEFGPPNLRDIWRNPKSVKEVLRERFAERFPSQRSRMSGGEAGDLTSLYPVYDWPPYDHLKRSFDAEQREVDRATDANEFLAGRTSKEIVRQQMIDLLVRSGRIKGPWHDPTKWQRYGRR